MFGSVTAVISFLVDPLIQGTASRNSNWFATSGEGYFPRLRERDGESETGVLDRRVSLGKWGETPTPMGTAVFMCESGS